MDKGHINPVTFLGNITVRHGIISLIAQGGLELTEVTATLLCISERGEKERMVGEEYSFSLPYFSVVVGHRLHG